MMTLPEQVHTALDRLEAVERRMHLFRQGHHGQAPQLW